MQMIKIYPNKVAFSKYFTKVFYIYLNFVFLYWDVPFLPQCLYTSVARLAAGVKMALYFMMVRFRQK